jgi:2-methylcitrate dehydratase PrpD
VTADSADRLASFAACLSLAAVPEAARLAAMRCVVDVAGVACAGSRTEFAARVRTHVLETHSAGECQLIGTPLSSSALGAALANGAAAHVLDFDDTCYAGIVHGSAVVLPAVLAAGQSEGIAGADLLAAFIAGCEVEYALGRHVGDGAYRWWTTAVLGAIGAAAGAARALGLAAPIAAEAIRIAACAGFGLRAVFGSSAKPYLCGRAAQAGLDAALAARAGIAGPRDAFEGRHGFFALFGAGEIAVDAFDRLGKRFALVDPGVAFKLFPVCTAAHAAVEATASLLAENGVSGQAVERVRCVTTPFVASCLAYREPRTVAEAQFSLNFAIGCILASGRLDLDCLAADNLVEPALGAAMAKIEMVVDDRLARSSDEIEAAEVTLFLRDGRTLQRHLPMATGMPAKAAPDDLLRAKFRNCALRALPSDRVEMLLGQLQSLGSLSSIRMLFA